MLLLAARPTWVVAALLLCAVTAALLVSASLSLLPVPKACQATDIPAVQSANVTSFIFTNTTLPALNAFGAVARKIPTVVEPSNITTAPEIDQQILALYGLATALWDGEVDGLEQLVDASAMVARAFESPLKIVDFLMSTVTDAALCTSTLSPADWKKQLELVISLVTTVALYPPNVVSTLGRVSSGFANFSTMRDHLRYNVTDVLANYQEKIEAAKLNVTMNATERNVTIAKYQALIYDVDNITAINDPILRNYFFASITPSDVLEQALGYTGWFGQYNSDIVDSAAKAHDAGVPPPLRCVSLFSARNQILYQRSNAQYQWATGCLYVFNAQQR